MIFPLQRQFTQAFDRETGVRPNPSLGAPGGYYVDSSQTMDYNGLQTSLRKTVLQSVTRGMSTTRYGQERPRRRVAIFPRITSRPRDGAASFENNQDFFNPEYDRGPASNDVRHRFNVSFIYETPGLSGGQGMTNAFLGRLAVLRNRSGPIG